MGICGDFNYWLDNPSLKPYNNESMSLLDINNTSNYVQVPTHISGHILNLILTPVGGDLVNQALITFELDVIGPTTDSKKITFRSYQGLNMREATSIIEDDLLSTVVEALTSVQCVDSYNRGFTSLTDQFCPLITKEIRVRDDAEWYDYRVVSLHRERRRAERRWRRIGSDAARTLFVSARRAVVKQIYTCKIEYCQHQMSQCDADQRRTSIFLNNLMGRTLDPVMPTSSSDDELASRFSNFFLEKITRIRNEIDVAVVNREFSVDFPLRFTRSFTFSHLRLVTEADVLG